MVKSGAKVRGVEGAPGVHPVADDTHVSFMKVDTGYACVGKVGDDLSVAYIIF